MPPGYGFLSIYRRVTAASVDNLHLPRRSHCPTAPFPVRLALSAQITAISTHTRASHPTSKASSPVVMSHPGAFCCARRGIWVSDVRLSPRWVGDEAAVALDAAESHPARPTRFFAHQPNSSPQRPYPGCGHPRRLQATRIGPLHRPCRRRALEWLAGSGLAAVGRLLPRDRRFGFAVTATEWAVSR